MTKKWWGGGWGGSLKMGGRLMSVDLLKKGVETQPEVSELLRGCQKFKKIMKLSTEKNMRIRNWMINTLEWIFFLKNKNDKMFLQYENAV